MSTRSGVLRSDGGARGNPGPAAAAFVLEDEAGAVVAYGGRFLGESTNNVAEYEGLIWGLATALAEGFDAIDVYCDSELVVRQLNGAYRVKHANMKPLFEKARALMGQFGRVTVRHVRREENAHADSLVNEAIDARSHVGSASEPVDDGSPQRLFE